MFRKKILIIIAIISVFGVVVAFSMMSTGATTQQDESLRLKHQLEDQDKNILDKMNEAATKVRNSNQAQIEISKVKPLDQPEEYKKSFQWNKDGFTQRHDLKQADTVWTAYGIVETSGNWDEFVVWSGQNEAGHICIGTLVTPDGFSGKYNAIYECPNLNIGRISITDIKAKVVYFKSENGSKGTFNLETFGWIFDK